MAFPDFARVRFEAEVLFPLAGLDPGRADEYYRVHQLVQQLSYAGNEAGANASEGARWQAFTELLSSPRVPSTLR